MQAKRPRRGNSHFHRVKSANPVQTFFTSLLVASDPSERGDFDRVTVMAVGSWYGPDVTGLFVPAAQVHFTVRVPRG